MLWGYNLTLYLLGELTDPFSNRTLLLYLFFPPYSGQVLPYTIFYKRFKTASGTLKTEYLKSGLWAATHESFLPEKVSECSPRR